jgi:hypothetical protein
MEMGAMRVSIKDFQVSMELGNNGIEFDVYEGDTHLGDLRIGRGKIEWCKGRVRAGGGNKVSWKELIEWLESRGR